MIALNPDYLNLGVNELKSLNSKEQKDIYSYYLEKIKDHNKTLNAFITVNESTEVYGLPIAIKDNINIKGIKTTCASKILENYHSPYDATVIRKLRNNNFVFLGKTNLDEFAMGSSTEFSIFGSTKNPWDKERIAGGSSGGSAAAVAAGLSPFALGSDTGGSVRQPASLCGVVGFKPTYGLVSRYGLVAFSSSLDQIGPITRSVDDAFEIFKVISGKDSYDATTTKSFSEYPDTIDEQDISNYSFCVPKEFMSASNLEDEVKTDFLEMIEILKKKGARVEFVSIPLIKYVVAAYYLIAPGEASSNLSRYDGIKYGKRQPGKDFQEIINESRDKGFGPEVKRRILLGTFTLSAGYYEAYYNRALKVRRKLSEKITSILKEYDFILNPTSPVVAPKLGEIQEPLTYYLMDLFTIPANLTGAPAISIPVTNRSKLPVGLHLMGKRFSDVSLLSAAKALEKLSPAYNNGKCKLKGEWSE
ncbi:MAG: Asp-tRNA(Asn)/Glu-tRNA(Gln) amidotransferase subunit GatA [Kosmotogaceae bacterium]